MFAGSKLISAGAIRCLSRRTKRFSRALERFTKSARARILPRRSFHSFKERLAFERELERVRAENVLHRSF